MTPAQVRFWRMVHARVARMQPDMAASVLKSFAAIRGSLSEAELVRHITTGNLSNLEALSDAALDRALIPLRSQIHRTVESGFDLTIRDLPRAGRVDGVTAVGFNHLNPRVIDAVRVLDTRVLSSLKDEVRETVQSAVERGLEAGQAPRTVARGIREVIGLGKTQAMEVENFRDALRGLNDRRVVDYTLRNRTVDRLLKKGPLTPEQVERYTETYRKARIASNANTVSRTATTDSYRLGQDLSWKEAQANGVVPEGMVLRKQWTQIQRPTKREEHEGMNGEVVNFDQPYSNGSQIPGDDGSYNCGCLSRVFVARAA